MPMKYQVITTFHQQGYNLYGSRMIKTWLETWPSSVGLKVYAENCAVTQTADNLEVVDIDQQCPDLVQFKNKWRNVPKANGNILGDPVRAQRRDSRKSFKWDAIRFSHKVYSVFDAARTSPAKWLLWMDADMVCHAPMTLHFLDNMCPDDKDLCFLGRLGKFSECGLYAMQLSTPGTQSFLQEFARMYDHAEQGIFTLAEWHDSFVFDIVRRSVGGLRELDWSSCLGDLRRSAKNTPGEGHPLINSAWGAYLDHLKGDNRKQAGRSLREDIKVARNEHYWQNL